MSTDLRLSKFLSLVLRHDPFAAGVTLDESGWCDLASLIEGARRAGFGIAHADVLRVVEQSDKKRYALSEDGRRIRANQGHSVKVDLQLTPATPPETLYHGTVARFLDPILREGLRKMARQHVHLSADRETAGRVGERRGRPVILVVHAGKLHAAGVLFYLAANGVWLVEAVPAEFLAVESESSHASNTLSHARPL